MSDGAPFAIIVQNCCTPTVVPMDVRSICIADIGLWEPGDQPCGYVATVLDKVRLAGPLWLMRVVMRVNTIADPAENEMVRRETLGLGLPDGTEMLT